MRTPDMTFASGRKSVREQHARSAFGVVQVPMGGVEIALVAEVASQSGLALCGSRLHQPAPDFSFARQALVPDLQFFSPGQTTRAAFSGRGEIPHRR